jgi:outer membrane protein assembly factor BamB
MLRPFPYLIQLILSLVVNIACTEPDLQEDEGLLLWKRDLNQIQIAFASAGITIDNNFLYFADSYNRLFKIKTDGNELTGFNIQNGSTFGVPVILDSIVVVGTSSNGANSGTAHLYVLNKKTFDVIWSKHNFWWHIVPAIDEFHIYCTDWDKVYVFDKITGQEVWTKEIFGKNTYNPVVEDDRLYIATGSVFKEDGYLYCLNKFSGEVIFQDTIPLIEENDQQFGGSGAGAQIWNDYIFVPSENRYLYCFNKSNGELVWKFLADAPLQTPASVSDGIVYTGSLNSTCYAINVETGGLIWSYQTFGSIGRNPPQFYNNYVLFESGAILIFDKYSGDLVLELTGRTGKYGYFTAAWNFDGKFFATGFDKVTDKKYVFAYQF